MLPPIAPVAAQTLPARCQNNGDYGIIIDQDTVWSDDVYIGQDLRIRNAVLTIEPGVTIFFCGNYNLQIGDLFAPASLNAVGTADAPIVFEPAPTVANWGWLSFQDSLEQVSVLQHAMLRRGGARSPASSDAAALSISNRHDPPGLASPQIDQVRVEQSASNGIFIYPDVENDPTPAVLSRVTVTGSARAPFRMAAAAATGLGEGIVTENNAIERIQIVGDDLRGDMFFDQYWRNHGTPYEILGNLLLQNRNPANTAFTTWEIQAGTTLLIHENRSLTIGGLISSNARLIARGTEDAPIIFTRADETVPQWGRITLNNFTTAASELHWVELLHGGGEPNLSQPQGVVTQQGRGLLTMANVTIKFSKNAAFYSGFFATSGGFQISDSLFELNRIGLQLWDTRGSVRGSRFVNNIEGAIRNNRANTSCVDAAGNWWGDASGPADASDAAADACTSAGRTNSGSGDGVSDGVVYWPWLQNAAGVPQDRSSISPGVNFWIIADGADSALLTVTLRDANGLPLSGKTVRLETTRGTLTQPATPTDALGRTTATITSTTPGEAVITGVNVTDNTALETRATLIFWQGSGDTGGLVQSGGTPYARPDLVIEGQPFEVGFPVAFRLPMRNTNAAPVDVTVDFRVSNFGIGQTWTPVATQTRTLAPGETWNAQAGFIPPDTEHRCVAYDITYTTASGQVVVANNGSFSGQRNLKNATTPQAPPKKCDPNAKKLIPTKVGIKGVRKHLQNLQQQTQQIICVLNRDLGFDTQALSNERDYRTVVTPRSFTAQPLLAGNDVTQAQAAAGTTMAQVVAQLNGLDLALFETYARMQRAAEAGDWASALVQSRAYRTFQLERADALDHLAAAVDALIAANLAAGFDPIYSSNDYNEYLAALKADGYDADTVAFQRNSGLSEAEIAALLATEIATLEQNLPTAGVSLNGILRDLAAESRTTAQTLRAFLPAAQLAQANGLEPVASNAIPFVVGNPTDSAATVTLVIRPIDLPLHWRASLDHASIALEAGAQTEAILTLDPGGQSIPRDVDIHVAVEGYINDELIGGIIIRQRLPGTASAGTIFLPLMQR
jgi:hypothetical protein